MIEHACIEDLGNIHIVYDGEGGWVLKNQFMSDVMPILSGISYCPYCGEFLDYELEEKGEEAQHGGEVTG